MGFHKDFILCTLFKKKAGQHIKKYTRGFKRFKNNVQKMKNFEKSIEILDES